MTKTALKIISDVLEVVNNTMDNMDTMEMKQEASELLGNLRGVLEEATEQLDDIAMDGVSLRDSCHQVLVNAEIENPSVADVDRLYEAVKNILVNDFGVSEANI